MITDTQIEATVAIARDYLADRRLPLPRAHDMAVALVQLVDMLATHTQAASLDALAKTVERFSTGTPACDSPCGEPECQRGCHRQQRQMQQLWTAAGLVFGAEQLAMALVILRQGGRYQVLHGGTIRGQVAADVLEEQVKTLRGDAPVAPSVPRICQYNGGTCTRRGCAGGCQATRLVAERAAGLAPGTPSLREIEASSGGVTLADATAWLLKKWNRHHEHEDLVAHLYLRHLAGLLWQPPDAGDPPDWHPV